MRRRFIRTLLAAWVGVACTTELIAQGPNVLTYQGRKPADGDGGISAEAGFTFIVCNRAAGTTSSIGIGANYIWNANLDIGTLSSSPAGAGAWDNFGS